MRPVVLVPARGVCLVSFSQIKARLVSGESHKRGASGFELAKRGCSLVVDVTETTTIRWWFGQVCCRHSRTMAVPARGGFEFGVVISKIWARGAFGLSENAKGAFGLAQDQRGEQRGSTPSGIPLRCDFWGCYIEQIHEDDLEAMDLKWQLSLLSMRAKRECRAPRNKEGQFRNQDNTRK
ncbi:hypothetical protein Tco_1552841 [Tanacetum coccineum]